MEYIRRVNVSINVHKRKWPFWHFTISYPLFKLIEKIVVFPFIFQELFMSPNFILVSLSTYLFLKWNHYFKWNHCFSFLSYLYDSFTITIIKDVSLKNLRIFVIEVWFIKRSSYRKFSLDNWLGSGCVNTQKVNHLWEKKVSFTWGWLTIRNGTVVKTVFVVEDGQGTRSRHDEVLLQTRSNF